MYQYCCTATQEQMEILKAGHWFAVMRQAKFKKNQKIQLCKWLKCVVNNQPKCKKTRLTNLF